jgi:hypothetical protein
MVSDASKLTSRYGDELLAGSIANCPLPIASPSLAYSPTTTTLNTQLCPATINCTK